MQCRSIQGHSSWKIQALRALHGPWGKVKTKAPAPGRSRLVLSMAWPWAKKAASPNSVLIYIGLPIATIDKENPTCGIVDIAPLSQKVQVIEKWENHVPPTTLENATGLDSLLSQWTWCVICPMSAVEIGLLNFFHLSMLIYFKACAKPCPLTRSAPSVRWLYWVRTVFQQVEFERS